MSYDEYIEPYHIDPPPSRPPVVVILGIIVVAFVALYLGAQALAGAFGGGEAETVANPGAVIEVSVPSGSTARGIGAILEEAGVIVSAGDFERAVRDQGVADRLRAGDYELVAGDPLDSIIAILTEAPDVAETFRLTVIEGLRIDEMLASMAEDTDYDAIEFETALRTGEVTSPLLQGDADDLQQWEGLLFPSTYEFVVNAQPREILQKMANELAERVAGVDWSALEDRGLTPYDGIIIASLIEKEAKLDEDRDLISSVIENRLDVGMALQIDATIVYALGEVPDPFLQSYREIESPYNSYTNVGLPPTPISGVRQASLVAAANPAESEFIYYALIDPAGKHGFAITFEEFLAVLEEGRASGALGNG